MPSRKLSLVGCFLQVGLPSVSYKKHLPEQTGCIYAVQILEAMPGLMLTWQASLVTYMTCLCEHVLFHA